MDRADRVALRPGALWHEADRGTNAIGTALADQRPVVIQGAEHYLERNSFLTCAAAPVRTSSGQLQGVLDISGDQRAHHPHTFALVRSAARMIEDRLFHARHGRDQVLRLHHLPEGLGAVGEGLVALSDDGWVVGANALAQQWLGLDETRIGTGTLAQLTGIQSGLMPPGRIWRLHTPGDRALYGRMDPRARLVLNMPSATQVPASRQMPAHAAVAHRASAPDGPDAAKAHHQEQEQEPRLQDALQRALRVQAQGIAVLVQGESGSGKEVFARALHAQGDRAHKPFVAVNCAALPETLIEAELFGYVRDARVRRAASAKHTAARSSWMRLATCPCHCKRACCVFCKTRSWCHWVGASLKPSISCSSAPHTASCATPWQPGPSAKTCTTGSMA